MFIWVNVWYWINYWRQAGVNLWCPSYPKTDICHSFDSFCLAKLPCWVSENIWLWICVKAQSIWDMFFFFFGLEIRVFLHKLHSCITQGALIFMKLGVRTNTSLNLACVHVTSFCNFGTAWRNVVQKLHILIVLQEFYTFTHTKTHTVVTTVHTHNLSWVPINPLQFRP